MPFASDNLDFVLQDLVRPLSAVTIPAIAWLASAGIAEGVLHWMANKLDGMNP